MAILIRRVLLTTDFSEAAAYATKYACALAEQFDAELHVLHVIDDVVLLPEYRLALYPENPLTELRRQSQEALETVIDPDWRKAHRVVLAMEVGRPHAQIVEYATAQQIDLIVLSTRGRSGLMHVLLGSVAERVVRTSLCPVLTVRPQGHDIVPSAEAATEGAST